MAKSNRPSWAQVEAFIARSTGNDNHSLCWDPPDVMLTDDAIRDDGSAEVAVYKFSHIETMRNAEPRVIRKKV